MQKIERPRSRQFMPESARCVFKGVIYDVYQWEQELFDGTKTTFEKVKRADTVMVIPVLDDGRLLLSEQEQPGKEPYIGLPGGRVEDGEDVLETARRELFEEVGYEASEFVLWDVQQPHSKIDWALYTLIAKGLKKVDSYNPDKGERNSHKPVTLDEFLDIAYTNKFGDKEIALKLLEAKLDPIKRQELRKLFSPK